MNTAPPTGPTADPATESPNEPASAPATESLTDCHVVTHVHWDREWYRPFEAFRARLVELAERLCDELDDGRMGSFHLDGQTSVLADIQALRPDLAERLRGHAADGRVTLGPWHVLADNQLVSGESLIRNLLTARRWGRQFGTLANVGYCPDAFGHPADLPRILNGFGMDTALVWRGAPDGVARFRWRAPDGSEVFAVNQGYHGAEVLWPDPDGRQGQATRLKDFAATERARLPEGPWLLMNGGDHLAPTDTTRTLAALAEHAAHTGLALRQSTLEDFFASARAAADDAHLPLVEGPLRHRPGRLTFILPGTLSARTDLKQANAAAQTLLERWAEPLVALHAPRDPSLLAELRHAWDLLLSNAPHDSICGCSVDEVHRENAVRFDRVQQTGRHIVQRALAASGLDTRLYGPPPGETATVAVLNPHAEPTGGPVLVDLLTAPGRHPHRITAPDGTEIPFECETSGPETAFEADLDLLPDSQPALRHRLALAAHAVPALGRAVYTVQLRDEPAAEAAVRLHDGERRLPLADGMCLRADADASFTVNLPDGTELAGVARLLDEGDRGDTYNFDPVPGDRPVTARLVASRLRTSAVRSVLEVDAVLDLPTGLTADRTARAAVTRPVPVRVTAEHWPADGSLHWRLQMDNTVDDHRLRVHFPTPVDTGHWTADAHFSLLDHATGPDLGPLPTQPAHEAEYGAVPVQNVSAIGTGPLRVTVAAPGLPERTGLSAPHSASGHEEIAVTLLRGVGWLSRFDLAARTTGAGPMLPTPQAQVHGPHAFALRLAFGDDAGTGQGIARLAAHTAAPLLGVQARPDSAPRPLLDGGIQVDDALLTALKPAEDGRGVILRLSNPTPRETHARLRLAPGTHAQPVRLDETPARTDQDAAATGTESLVLPMGPYAVLSLRLTTG